MLGLGAVIWIISDRGRVVVQADSDDIQVVVVQNGVEIKTIDLRAGSTSRWLPTGAYQIKVPDNRADVKLDRNEFTLDRWRKQVVTATHYPSNPRALKSDSAKPTVVNQPRLTMTGHTAAILDVAISPDGKSAASCGLDRTIRIWDLTTGNEVRKIAGHDDDVNDVHFLPDGRRVISCSSDNTIRIWNALDGSELQRFNEHTAPVRSLDLSLGGGRLLSGGDDQIVRLWDLDSGEVLREFKLSKPIREVAFFPDGRQVLAGADGYVYWWVGSGDKWRQGGWMQTPTDVASLAPARDSNHALFGPVGGNVFVWDWRHRQIIHRLIGHAGPILDMHALEDNRVIVASGDRSLRIWDYVQNRELARFQDHLDRVEAVAVSADGRWIVSGGGWHQGSRRPKGHGDFALRLWRMPGALAGEVELAGSTRTGVLPLAEELDTAVIAQVPFGSAEARRHQELWAAKLGVAREVKNSLGIQLQLIPPGRFSMGTTEVQIEELKPRVHEFWHEHLESESPPRELTIDQPFYMAAHEITFDQFRQFTEATGYKTEAESSGLGGTGFAGNPGTDNLGPQFNWRKVGYEQAGQFPVTNVTQADAEAFCRWLTETEGITYRPPREDEWEFACRAGTTTRWSFGDEPHLADDFAWHKGNAAQRPHPVGAKKSNAFGLYDMHGNVLELCASFFVETLPNGDSRRWTSLPAERPDDDSIAEHWVVRDGGFLRETQWSMRSSSRMSGAVKDRPTNESKGKFYIGFRVVREATPPHAVAPFSAATARQRQQTWGKALGVPVEFTNTVGIQFTLIPPGEFDMGSTPDQIDAILSDAKTRGLPAWHAKETLRETSHRVRITRPFYISTHEVTQKQMQDVTHWYERRYYVGTRGEHDDHPARGVDWTSLHSFCNQMRDRLTERPHGRRYRLPTEAEWEFACRAGTDSIYFTGDDIESLVGHANIADAALKNESPEVPYAATFDDGYADTAPVGSFQPNAFGLYDMLGNVAEWCEDYRDLDYYEVSPPADPTGPKSGSLRAVRGGSCRNGINRSAFRGGFGPTHGKNIGVRVVCEVN